MNDGIDPEVCSLSYVTVDDAARAILSMGRGTLLAKVDIKSAYRIVPVHPEDRSLLGMKWNGALYVDATLPFGLRSAPKIFTALADALEWRLKYEGVETVFHYLDDFLIVSPLGSRRCGDDLHKLETLFNRLRVPIAPEKLAGPSTVLTFLGVELDTRALILCLPDEKLRELKSLLVTWIGKEVLPKKGPSILNRQVATCIEGSTTGQDIFASHVRPSQRDSSKTAVHTPEFCIPIRSGMVAGVPGEMEWVINDADGTGNIPIPSDHRRIWILWLRCRWLQYPWPDRVEAWSIAVKELIPIVVALMLWGQLWTGKVVEIHCDNKTY